jgi:hypothetical protein
MSRIELFLETVHDLRHRVDAARPYDVLGISALVRKLFLEQHPLVDQVNSGRRIVLHFTVNERMCQLAEGLARNLHPQAFFSAQDGFDPVPGRRARLLSRSAFFRLVVLFGDGEAFTVKDLVLYCAHRGGGVHAGRLKGKQRVLEALDAKWRIGGRTVAIDQLRSIARIVLVALEPLETALQPQG